MTQPTPDVSGTVFEDTTPELTRVYAEALLGAATSAGAPDATLDELEELVADVWKGEPGFALMMTSPAVEPREKERILDQAFGGRLSATSQNFLKVLVRHGRLQHLEPIVRRARASWDRRQGRRPVTVRSAVPLDPGQQSALIERLTSVLQATPVLRLEVDPELIGGLVVQIGDIVYDSSVRNRYLEQLRRRLLQDRTHEVLARSASFTTS